MTLTSQRSTRIAAMISALGGQRAFVPAYAQGSIRGRGTIVGALRGARQWEASPGSGAGVALERRTLAALVARGDVTAGEAEEFLAERYPAQRFSGGRFGDLGPTLGAPGQDPTIGVDGSAVFRVPNLPETYEPKPVQDAIKALAEDTARRFHAVKVEPPEFPVHSIGGEALAPGTVPPEAIDLPRLGKELVAWPREEESIVVPLAQSLTMDRLVARASTGVSGPGRIWEAQPAILGEKSRAGLGPARYRLVQTNQPFGILSCRLPPDADLGANNTPGILLQYGIVVRGIPHYLGRPPRRILAVEAVGDAPTSFRTLFATGGGASWASGGTSRNFYWNRTQTEHLDQAPYPFAEAFGVDANLYPSGGDLRDFYGFSFQIITGRDGGEVFRQLSSRATLGRGLYRSGHGIGASIPPGLPLEAPATPNVVDWQSPTSYIHRIEGYDLTTAGTRIVCGMPFSYSDCAALAATDSQFSVVIQVVGEKLLSQAGLSTLATPEEWHRNGVKTAASVAGRLRTWALDIIVD